MKNNALKISGMLNFMASPPLGDEMADKFAMVFLVHLHEVYEGRGLQGSYDACSTYLQAMISAANSVKIKGFHAIVLSACNAWIEADQTRMKNCTEEIILNDNQKKIISMAVRVFLMALPNIKTELWAACIKKGVEVLERSIAASKSTC